MKSDLHKKLILILAVTSLAVATGAPAADVNLPDIGSPADATLSKNEENQLGRAIMRQIRASGALVEDPQITEYINEIGHRVAAQANADGTHEFTFFVINDPSINAFALPGGFIGVHTGLLEATRNEDELAGVLAHEVAHVTQRHIARAIHASKRQSLLSTAIMLGAIIAGAAGAGSDVMVGGMAAAQGSAAQAQINFTRSNEYEADRIGIASLAAAGFDPQGMASFFEVISRNTSHSANQIPNSCARTRSAAPGLQRHAGVPAITHRCTPRTRSITALRERDLSSTASALPRRRSHTTNRRATSFSPIFNDTDARSHIYAQAAIRRPIAYSRS